MIVPASSTATTRRTVTAGHAIAVAAAQDDLVKLKRGLQKASGSRVGVVNDCDGLHSSPPGLPQISGAIAV
jgi:hypothetical protein